MATRTSPEWWQPVMKALKPKIDTIPNMEIKAKDALWEYLREATAGAVRVDLLPWYMTEQEAKNAVCRVWIAVIEFMADPERDFDALFNKLIQISLETEREEF